MIISFLNQKGGVGKTTFAFNIGLTLSNNKNFIMVDADPQKSLTRILSFRKNNEVKSILDTSFEIDRTLQNLVEKYDLVIVDAGGFDDERFRKILAYSDIVLIPIKPSPLDSIVMVENVAEIIHQANEYGYHPKIILFFNMMKKKASINEFVENYVKKNIDINKISLIHTSISETLDYQYSILSGETVLEYKKSKKNTKIEFEKLMEEINKEIQYGE